MNKILLTIILGLILVTPVIAEIGSISVVADPKDFSIKEYIQQDITGQIIDSKDGIPITASYQELLHISPIFFNNKISYSIDDMGKIPNELIIRTPVNARYKDMSGKWDGMEYTAPSGTYTLSVDTNGIIAALVNAIKEQQATIEAQQQNITKLEERITALEKKVGV
jgi:hypothetical protein